LGEIGRNVQFFGELNPGDSNRSKKKKKSFNGTRSILEPTWLKGIFMLQWAEPEHKLE
jgi:hypothetical protein